MARPTKKEMAVTVDLAHKLHQDIEKKKRILEGYKNTIKMYKEDYGVPFESSSYEILGETSRAVVTRRPKNDINIYELWLLTNKNIRLFIKMVSVSMTKVRDCLPGVAVDYLVTEVGSTEAISFESIKK